MKRLLTDYLIRYALDFLRFTNLYNIFEPDYGGIGHILMFHRIVRYSNHNKFINQEIEITPGELELCIEYYRRNNYLFVSLDEVYDILTNKLILDKKFVSFTFDDGYADTFTNAYPIMKRYDVPFAVYLTTGIPDRTTVLWWYLLEELLSQHDNISFEINDKVYYFKCKTNVERYCVFRKMRGIILDSHQDDYMVKLRRIFDPYGIDLYKTTEELGINWDQIKAMSQDPKVTIASHGVNHLALNKISNEAIRKEIVESVKRIEEQLWRKVEHFSYPFGSTENGPREFEIVRAYGFKTATTTRFANVFPEHGDHLCCLPRIYKVGKIPKVKYLDVLASGALSALTYKFKRIVTA